MQETARILVSYAVKNQHLDAKDVTEINYWERKLKPTANLNNKNYFL
jgi:hypothetical protein